MTFYNFTFFLFENIIIMEKLNVKKKMNEDL